MQTHENLLIASLPRQALARFLSSSVLVDLPAVSVLWKPRERSTLAYFPLSGYVSLVACDGELPALEVAMIGREGMAGAHLLLGALSSSLHASVGMEGSAHACDSKQLILLMRDCTPFRAAMARYIDFTLQQFSTAAVCIHFHCIEQRLAKWLLMALDRTLEFNQEQGTTLLFVTHNPELAQRCDKTIQVIDGHLTE